MSTPPFDQQTLPGAPSGVDPTWAPPQVPKHRPHPIVYVLAFVLPLILVGLVMVPWGIARLDWLPGAADKVKTLPGSTTDQHGGRGVGDPYFVDYGSSGWDAQKYAISVSWDPTNQQLTGTSTITATALQDLESFYFDLALNASRVQVQGADAAFEQQGFQDVQVTPTKPITTGESFTVTVDYVGQPGEVKKGKITPWRTANEEWTIAGEPESAAWWFPSNDHPRDPAMMDISLRVPSQFQAISIGRLESRDTGKEKDFDTWHWVSSQPTLTYLVFASIGRFDIHEGEAQGRPYVYAVSQQVPAAERKTAFTAMQKTPDVILELEKMFGPYPFTEIGGIVPAATFPFGGLETQTRPLYERGAILDPGFSTDLIVHELAHMWFGDNVTLHEWNDIFNNEGYASWAQWGYEERTGGLSADDRLDKTYNLVVDNDDFWKVTMIDPGANQLFDTVYLRGPMVLQALRNVMGDEKFFAIARDWSQDPGARSVEDWMAFVQSRSEVDLDKFFQVWIYGTKAPDRTAELGFR